MSPTMHDLLSQSREECTSSDGSFGLVEESAREQIVVSFQYSVTLDTTELSQEEYLSTVLPKLETEMNNYVVPVLFAQVCGAQHRSLSESVGLSAAPTDKILDEADFCVDATANCYSILGQITLYLNNTQRRLEDYSALFLETLKKGVDEGVFDSNPPIQNVSFIPLETDDGIYNGSRGSAVSVEGDNDNSGGPNVHRILAATWFTFLGLMAVAAIFYVVRRNRQLTGDEQMQSLSQR